MRCAACLPSRLPCLARRLSPPIILNHPPGVTAYIGDTVTLTATVGGSAPLTFQWQKNSIVIPGATNTSLTLPTITLNDLGPLSRRRDQSLTARRKRSPRWSMSRSGRRRYVLNPTATTAIAGSSIVLSATSSANLPVTLTLVSGAASLSGNVLTGSGGNVLVRATQAGDETVAPAETVERIYSFVSGTLSPFITSPPLDQTVTAGASVTLRGTAIGTPAPTYQWQKDGTAIAGATTPTLTLATPSRPMPAGTRSSRRTSPGTASASATLTVRTAPVITIGARKPDALRRRSRELHRRDHGRSGARRCNGGKTAPLSRARPIATLTFASAAATDAGRYDVVVTNRLGSVTSAPATLTVNTRDFSGSTSAVSTAPPETSRCTFAPTAPPFSSRICPRSKPDSWCWTSAWISPGTSPANTITVASRTMFLPSNHTRDRRRASAGDLARRDQRRDRGRERDHERVERNVRRQPRRAHGIRSDASPDFIRLR